MGYKFDCRLFTGYKPCQYKRSCDNCPHYQKAEPRIAIVSLEALGAVLRTTVLLHPLKRKFPNCHITWITYPNARALLANNPLIDRIIAVDASTITILHHMKFDFLYAVDKSMEAGALAEVISADEKFGFGLTPQGAIRPLTEQAQYQFDVGLDDELKFFKNQKAETQQITESMGLEWQRDGYVLQLTNQETELTNVRRQELLKHGGTGVIGYNTGCSLLYPNKKFTIGRSIELIKAWRQNFPDKVVALLGGREDCDRQTAMKEAFANDNMVQSTPTQEGLRSGVIWMNTSDLVFTGCSLGLHIAVALSKPVVAWFGVSCSQEIDLYEKGVKLIAKVPCTPCWKKGCDKKVMCYDMVEINDIMNATQQLLSTVCKDH